MHKTFAIAIVGLFIVAAIPGVSAETKTANYDVPSGPTGNFGVALSTSFGSDDWDDEWWCVEDDDVCEEPLDLVIGTTLQTARSALGKGNDGIVNIGVYSSRIQADSDAYTNFLVTVTDTLPTSSFFAFCVITEHQDGRGYGDSWCGENLECDPDLNPADCDDIEDPAAEGCSSVEVTSPVPAGGPENGPTAFVYATYVDDTTGAVCLASKGSLTVQFS